MSDEVQAVVRQRLRALIEQLREGLDYEAEFRAKGSTWVEADEDGNLRHRS